MSLGFSGGLRYMTGTSVKVKQKEQLAFVIEQEGVKVGKHSVGCLRSHSLRSGDMKS